jgi:hypothetical protein
MLAEVTQSYHDSALDGIYQARAGWGHVEAPAAYRDEILAMIEDIRRQASSAGTDPQEDEAEGE